MNPAVLVVGGSGILRDVAASLARRADVTAVTRGRRPLPPGVRRLVRDTARPGTDLPGRWDAAVVYAPAAHPAVLRRIRRATRGPVVLVLPSAMRLGGVALAVRSGAVPVVLGWTGPPDAPRWHTPAEIAPAVLTALTEGRPVRLGRLTGSRPS